mgnify:CR=1 FL=1
MSEPIFFTPDLAELDRLGNDATVRERSRKQFDDIRWCNLQDGVITFILTPPFSTRGVLQVGVASHFNLPHYYFDEKDKAQKLDDKGVYCPQGSVPERQWGCPICAALSMLRTVVTQIQKNHTGDVTKALNRGDIRLYTHFNAIVLSAIDPRGNPQVDGGQPLVGPLPRIVKGPPALGDFVAKALREYKGKMYDPSGAIPLRIERNRTGPNPQDVKYSYQYVPGGVVPLAASTDGLSQVAANIYDLDRVFNPEKRWTKGEWERSAAKAMEMVKRWGFHLAIDRLPEFPQTLKELQEKTKKDDGGHHAASTSPVVDLAAVAQAQQTVVVTTMVAPPPNQPALFHDTAAPITSQPSPVDLGLLTGARPVSSLVGAAVVSPLQPAAQIVRNPSAIDPTTGAPFCKGNYLGTDSGCVRCAILDVCMVEAIERNMRQA